MNKIDNDKYISNTALIPHHLNAVLSKLFKQHPELEGFVQDIYFAGKNIKSIIRRQRIETYELFFSNQTALDDFSRTCTQQPIAGIFNTIIINPVKGMELHFDLMRAALPTERLNDYCLKEHKNYYIPLTEELYIEDYNAILEEA